jgi:hypothetical protein
MLDFAIVAEGFTDQVVLKNILLGFFSEWDEEPTVNFVQPLYDTTGQSAVPSPGGFDQVIKYFETGRFREALQLNRYLVVHIDTDVSDLYGVPWHADGRELTPEELIERVVARLRDLIGAEIWQAHGARFLFAVAVHSIECWLLPLCFDNNQKAKRAKIAGCLEAANHARRVAGQPPLSTGAARNEHKHPEVYAALSRAYAKYKTLMQHCHDNPSFAVFVRELERRSIPPR